MKAMKCTPMRKAVIEAATHFQKGLMYLLQQLYYTNRTDKMLLKRLMNDAWYSSLENSETEKNNGLVQTQKIHRLYFLNRILNLFFNLTRELGLLRVAFVNPRWDTSNSKITLIWSDFKRLRNIEINIYIYIYFKWRSPYKRISFHFPLFLGEF